ncbi:MAG: hypothetical protein ACR2PO_14580, partial [Methyloligellaceae bacterium]
RLSRLPELSAKSASMPQGRSRGHELINTMPFCVADLVSEKAERRRKPGLVFKPFQRAQKPIPPRPKGLVRRARLSANNARKGKKPCLALVSQHSNPPDQTEPHRIYRSMT